MFNELLKYLDNSYAVITNFKVSSCVVMKDGCKFFGVNVEDSSTRSGTCAERCAIFSSIAAGYKKGDFKEIHILTSGKKISTPCFNCRQMFVELFDMDTKVYCYNILNEKKEYTVKELCPYPFSEDDLK